MRLKRLKLYNSLGILYGLGKSELEIDFSEFKPGLILLQGKSGSGKSTILNNLHPYRIVGKDNFNKHFLDDGFRELEFEFKGKEYLSQIYTDKAQLFKNGILLNESGKVSVYDEIVEQEIGKEETFFDLLFAGRRFKNVLDMTKGEKKELVVDYLLSHLKKNEEYLETCKTEQREFIEKQKELSIKLQQKTEILGLIESYKEKLNVNNKEYEVLLLVKGECVKHLSNEQDLQDKYEQQEKDNQETRLQLAKEEGKLESLVLTLDQEKRRYNIHLETYNSVKLKYTRLKEELKDVIKPNYDQDEVKELIDQAYKNKDENFLEWQESNTKLQNLKLQITQLEEELKELKKSVLPCESDLQIQCPLTGKRNLKDLVSKKEMALKELQYKLESFEVTEYDESEHQFIISQLQKKQKNLTDYNNNLEKLKRKQELKQEGLELKKQKQEFEELLPKLTKKVVVQEEEIQYYKDQLRIRYSNNSERVELYQKELRQLDDKLLQSHLEGKSIREQLEDRKKELKKYDDYEEQIKALDNKILEYDNLIKFFGKDGIMMMELELAGTEISKVANRLLKNYENKEINLKFETMIPDSKGNLKDVFDIHCSINGGDWQTYLSDGESVLVSNSIREAMSYLKQSQDYKTVFLDELDGSIDSESRVGFLKLLEQGNEMNGREHIFLISHSQEVVAYCEQSITLKDNEIIIT